MASLTRELEWTPGVGDGQGDLACCNSWGRKELDTTERLNWTELNWSSGFFKIVNLTNIKACQAFDFYLFKYYICLSLFRLRLLLCIYYYVWWLWLLSHPVVWLFVILWIEACQDSLSLSISWSLLKFMSIASVMPFSHLILCCLLLLLPSIFPSIRDFSNGVAVPIRWPRHWSFSVSPSSEYSGLISIKIQWFDLLSAQGTLKSLFQHHSSNAPILRHSAFFTVQLSQLYLTTRKIIVCPH